MYLLRLIALFAPIALASPPLPLQINLPSHLPPLPPSTHVILRTHHLPLVTVPISTRNNFLFRNLTAGTYDLDVACREYDFEKGMTVVIGEEGEVQVARADGNIVARSEVNTKVGEEGGDGDWKMKGRLEVEMRVTRRREWREERGGFSPLSLLQNPMILIAVVGLGIVVGMPYLLDNMDPEMRAEFEEQQKKSILSGGASTGNPLQNFDMAAWMAGKTSGGANRETEAVQESKSSGAGNSGGGGGAKKRRG